MRSGTVRAGLAAALVVACTLTSGAQAPASQASDIDRLLGEAKAALGRADFADEQRKATEAAALSRTTHDDDRLISSLLDLSEATFYQTHPDECVTALREADGVANRGTNLATRARIANGLGVCYRALSQFDDATDSMRRAAEWFGAVGDHTNLARVQANISSIYRMLGETSLATDWADRATRTPLSPANPPIEAFLLLTRGNAEFEAGESDRAIVTFKAALHEIAEDASPIMAVLRSEIDVGMAYAEFWASRNTLARAAGERALDEIRRANQPDALGIAAAHLIIGASLVRTGDRSAALDHLLLARENWQQVGSSDYDSMRFATEIWLARVARGNGQTTEALGLDTAIINALERKRAGTRVTDTSSATAMALSADAYTDAIDLLFGMGRVDEAFAVSERQRARTFLDTLDEHRNGIGEAVTSDQHTREDALTAKAAAAQKELWTQGLPDARRQALTATLADIDESLDALHREVRRTDPRYADVRYPELASARDTIAMMDDDTVLLSYVLGDDRSFVWAISSSGVNAAILPSRKIIEARVDAFQSLLTTKPNALTSPSRSTRLSEQAEMLSRTLLDPIGSSLERRHRIVIVPDGALHTLSFAALAARGGSAHDAAWLGERFAISDAPSASALAALTRARDRPTPRAGFIAFGDPQFSRAGQAPGAALDSALLLTALPFTRLEVERVAALFPTSERRMYVGAAATEETVKHERLEDYRYVHFATHAFVNPIRPGRSGIVLTIDPASKEDGVLQADEVMRLHLNADLVTLSACQTGLGRMIAGEGVMGLARAFLYAGARSVVASLWNVNDSASAELMEPFYRGLVRGLPRDAALQAARSALIHSSDVRLHDPYYWAPFVLIGTAR